ncbi:esterase E4-like [Plodia interpunctella]|uniref:esterase E4-like n=1 Tax=Plodia interpunctella TaxID=58824 RepID=UPI002368BBDF|nr:esterase E4-like [Plodia interpunctella]
MKKMEFQNVILCTTLIGALCSASTPVVETEQGKLRGVRAGNVNQYFGIPYATSKRFHPPKEPKSWEGVFNAVNSISACAQTKSTLLIPDEDCLHLDVYTPENSRPGDKLPVFVFIHGGSFFSGTKALYNPENLVAKNIIAVTINYRLGVLGFLCVNGVANLGLKDQTSALRWINKNIAAFGGDPDQVTLAGQDSGAAAASMHMLSDQSAGLFHKVILMSGFALAPWSFNVDPVRDALDDANIISKAKTERDIYRVFNNAPIRELLTATRDLSTNLRNFKYSPCVDSELSDPFFRDTPYEIIKSGNFNKVPVMMGVTDQEGIAFYGSHNKSTFADLNTNFTEQLPAVFSCSEDEREEIANKIRENYFAKYTINEKAMRRVVKFGSDWQAHSTFDAVSDLLAEHSGEPVYKYVFSYDGSRNYFKMLFGGDTSKLKGASHNDDLFYVFKPVGVSLPVSKDDNKMIERYTTMIANFIKYSNPTPRTTSLLPEDWPPSTNQESYIMHLDRNLKVTKGPWQKDGFFLDQLCTAGLQGYMPCESQGQCQPDVSSEQKDDNWRNWFFKLLFTAME